MHKLQILVYIFLFLFIAPFIHAAKYDIDLPKDLEQNVFANLVKDLGAVISYRAVMPAEPLGSVGIDIGIEITATSLETDALDQVTNGDAPNTIYAAKVHIHKGLLSNLDLGAVYSVLFDSNARFFAAELRYAFLESGMTMPSLALRGTYSVLTGVPNFDLNSIGLELTLSKQFALWSLYTGAGVVWLGGDTALDGLASVSIAETKYLLGLNLNLGLLNLVAEWDLIGDNNSYTGKIGFRF